MSVTGKKDFLPNDESFLCSLHFRSKDYEVNPTSYKLELNPKAIPIFYMVCIFSFFYVLFIILELLNRGGFIRIGKICMFTPHFSVFNLRLVIPLFLNSLSKNRYGEEGKEIKFPCTLSIGSLNVRG